MLELSSPLNSEWFNQLEALEVWSVSEAEYSSNLVRQLLLYSPLMKNILFNSCTTLTDELWAEITQVYQLHRILKKIRIFKK